eukprot:m.259388 g.259388  ORF g.259388 m.259388 type:complete len:349 (-) comp37970_c0_seq1:83-1129(-)
MSLVTLTRFAILMVCVTVSTAFFDNTGCNQYCSNRGSAGGGGSHSKVIGGGATNCANWVLSNPSCGRAFSYGEGKYCDCVPVSAGTNCGPRGFGGYCTFLMRPITTTVTSTTSTITTSTATSTTTSSTHTQAQHMDRRIDNAIKAALNDTNQFAENSVVVELAKVLQELEIQVQDDSTQWREQVNALKQELQQTKDDFLTALTTQKEEHALTLTKLTEGYAVLTDLVNTIQGGLATAADTTTLDTITTIPAVCNGKFDPVECGAYESSACDDQVTQDWASTTCPSLCNTCVAVNTGPQLVADGANVMLENVYQGGSTAVDGTRLLTAQEVRMLVQLGIRAAFKTATMP